MAKKKRKKTGGRKKGEPTIVKRIPKFLEDVIDSIIDQHKKTLKDGK